jgi:hypothetical protein
MPRATVFVITDHKGDWDLACEWVERWRPRMQVCPEEPGGCLCCVAWWDVDAPTEALDELPRSLLLSSDWAKGAGRDPGPPEPE